MGRSGAHRGRNVLPSEVDDGRGATAGSTPGVFDVVEVNSSYYAIPGYPEHGAVGRADAAGLPLPRQGVLAVDGPSPAAGDPAGGADEPCCRGVLGKHAAVRSTRRASRPRRSIAPFDLMRTAVQPIAEAGKLGYVLFQLAPWVHFEAGRLEYLASLRSRLPGWTIAVEFRHRSWLPEHAAETLRALSDAGLAHVIVDGPDGHAVPRVTTVTAPTADFPDPRPQRAGLAPAAPRGGPGGAGKVRLPLQRGRAAGSCCRRSTASARRPRRSSSPSTTTTAITRSGTLSC